MVSSKDAALVQAVLDGDRSAYADLYDRYARLVRAICYDTTRDLTHAQDLSQEVFLRAYDKLGNLRNPDQFASWLTGIARNGCKEWQRRKVRDPHEFVERVPESQDCVRPETADQQTDRIRQAMCLLPERERLALHAFYLEGESAEAVRQVLNLSQSGVYRLLDRARKRLQVLLQKQQEERS